MGTPRIYSWSDTGAPDASNFSTADSYGGAAIGKILKACLVDGYGSKPAAGWVCPGDKYLNTITLQNASNTGTIHMVYGSSSWVNIVCMDTWTNASATYAGPVNGRSGSTSVTSSTALASLPHRIYNPHTSNSTYKSSVRWAVVADDESFALWMWSNGNTASSSSAGPPTTLYFGKMRSAFFPGPYTDIVAMGGANSTTNQTSTNYLFHGGYTTIRNLEGGAVGASWVGMEPWVGSSNSYNSFPTTVSASTHKMLVMCPSAVRNPATNGGSYGTARGVCWDPGLSNLGILASLTALGLPNSINSFGKPVLMEDGFSYAVIGGLHAQAFFTDNPAYW